MAAALVDPVVSVDPASYKIETGYRGFCYYIYMLYMYLLDFDLKSLYMSCFLQSIQFHRDILTS